MQDWVDFIQKDKHHRIQFKPVVQENRPQGLPQRSQDESEESRHDLLGQKAEETDFRLQLF